MRVADIALGKGDGSMMHANVSEWRVAVQRLLAEGFNAVVIDVADGFVYPRHPELAAKGAWSDKTLRAEIGHLRELGLEPIPCLDFSAGRCAWVGKDVESAECRALCVQLIEDVRKVFGHARFFQIAADGWTPDGRKSLRDAVVAKGYGSCPLFRPRSDTLKGVSLK
jgi:hypothetical protein